jgi:aspartate/methionine/tyrosine aminotransferase
MQIPDFKLERYFATYEFKVSHLLCPSDCESLTLAEALALAGDDARAQWACLGLGYTESPGHPALRAEIAGAYAGLAPEDTLVAAPEELIFLAMQVLLEPGDHAIVTFPAYQSLYALAESLGATVTRWTLATQDGRWALDFDALREAVTPRTRLLVVNFPHNPTGFLPSRAEFDGLIAFARHHGLTLFSDEMYRWLEYDPAQRLPAACEVYEKGVTLSGLSKSLSMPGARIGWLAARDRALLARCAALKDYTTICNSAPSEILALIALRAREQIVARNLAIIQQNLAAAEEFFDAHAARFEWLPPQAGPIAFPRLRTGCADDFCRDLLERESVLLLPASQFDYPGEHFRLGLGRHSFETGLARLAASVSR